ncbi:hypothetical protein ACWF9B_26015 [Streptomyces sp. NPDC055089]
MFCEAKLDFTEAVITHNTLRFDGVLRLGGNLILVTGPGVVVDTDGLARGSGEIKTGPQSGPATRPVLPVRLTGRSRGGDITARPPRRKLSELMRRRPPGNSGSRHTVRRSEQCGPVGSARTVQSRASTG